VTTNEEPVVSAEHDVDLDEREQSLRQALRDATKALRAATDHRDDAERALDTFLDQHHRWPHQKTT
jgi:hypothetical protein